MEQVIGWVSNILFIYGVWAIGVKRISGFYACIFANGLYVIQSVMMQNPSLLALSLLLIGLNAKGVYEWTKTNKKALTAEQEHAERAYIESLTGFYED